MQVEIMTRRTATASTSIELPVDNWDDVVEWYINGDMFFYRVRGSDHVHGMEMNSVVEQEMVDWDESQGMQVFASTVEGDIDYENPLYEDWG